MTQIFSLVAEHVISVGIAIKEAKTEIERHAITVETKMRKSSI